MIENTAILCINLYCIKILAILSLLIHEHVFLFTLSLVFWGVCVDVLEPSGCMSFSFLLSWYFILLDALLVKCFLFGLVIH